MSTRTYLSMVSAFFLFCFQLIACGFPNHPLELTQKTKMAKKKTESPACKKCASDWAKDILACPKGSDGLPDSTCLDNAQATYTKCRQDNNCDKKGKKGGKGGSFGGLPAPGETADITLGD